MTPRHGDSVITFGTTPRDGDSVIISRILQDDNSREKAIQLSQFWHQNSNISTLKINCEFSDKNNIDSSVLIFAPKSFNFEEFGKCAKTFVNQKAEMNGCDL